MLVPELKDIGGALYRATGNGTVPQITISLVHLRAGQIAGSTYLTVLHTGTLRAAGVGEERITAVASWRDAPYFTEQYGDQALVTLIMAIGQVCFFLPPALIGKPLPGVSPSEQWRR